MSAANLLSERRASRAVRYLLIALLLGATLFAISGVISANSSKERLAMTNIPTPILAFFEASNRGDAAGVVACFTANATLDDWGRHFEGPTGIASWDRTDNTGVQSHLVPVKAEGSGDTIVVTVKVRGNGFNGTGHMHFQLDGDKIARLDIK